MRPLSSKIDYIELRATGLKTLYARVPYTITTLQMLGDSMKKRYACYFIIFIFIGIKSAFAATGFHKCSDMMKEGTSKNPYPALNMILNVGSHADGRFYISDRYNSQAMVTLEKMPIAIIPSPSDMLCDTKPQSSGKPIWMKNPSNRQEFIMNLSQDDILKTGYFPIETASGSEESENILVTINYCQKHSKTATSTRCIISPGEGPYYLHYRIVPKGIDGYVQACIQLSAQTGTPTGIQNCTEQPQSPIS